MVIPNDHFSSSANFSESGHGEAKAGIIISQSDLDGKMIISRVMIISQNLAIELGRNVFPDGSV